MAYMMGVDDYNIDEEERRRREEEERRRLAAAQVAGPVAPGDQMQQLIDYTRQQESGGRPIGYHYPADAQGRRSSTAYGSLGITQPHYQEIQKQFPQFRNVPIEQANQQDLERANFEVFARQLKAQGVEPTPGNLAAAHLVGAAGAKRYLETGELDPKQAAQFGGMAGFKQAVDRRMQMQPAPASGAAMRPPATQAPVAAPVSPEQAAQQPLPQPTATPPPVDQYSLAQGAQPTAGFKAPGVDVNAQRSDQFINAQDKPDQLFAIRNDEQQPEWRRKAAGEQMYSLISNEKNIADAQQRMNDLGMRMAQGDRRASMEFSKEIQKEDGNFLKYLFFGVMGMRDLANQEAAKLGIGDTYSRETIIMPDGTEKMVEVRMRKDGSIGGARDVGTGEAIPGDILSTGLAGVLPKGVHISKVENVVNPTTGERIQEQTLSNGKVRYLKNGKQYTGSTEGFENANQFEQDQDRKLGAANSYLNKTYPAGATPEQKMAAYKQAGVHPRYIESVMGMPAGTVSGAAATQAAVPRPQATKTEVEPNRAVAQVKEDVYETPTQRPGESTADFNARKSRLEAKQKPLIKLGEDFVNRQTNMLSKLEMYRKGLAALDTGEHNIGPQIAGKQSLPGLQQAAGALVGTKASENTKLIESLLSEAGLQGIKDSFGPQISNFDVQAKMKQMPVSNRSNPDAVREYLLKEYRELYNATEVSRDNAGKLNLVDAARIDLGASPDQLKKRPPLKTFLR